MAFFVDKQERVGTVIQVKRVARVERSETRGLSVIRQPPRVSLCSTRATPLELMHTHSSGGEPLRDQDPFDRQKEMLADTFSQARSYTNIIMVAGYAGIFALWNAITKELTPETNLGVGILVAVSITTFVGWEIFGLAQRFAAMSSMRRSLDNPARAADEMERYKARAILALRFLERHWHQVIWVALGTAAAAMMMLLSGMCHALWLAHGARLFSGEDHMELNFLSIVLGGLIAGLVGFVCFRLEASRNLRAGRRALAATVADDLRTCGDLYAELKQKWLDEKYISFDLLEQIAFVRTTFNQDRPHFQSLGDSDIKTRLNTNFRESYVTLMKMRPKQQEICAVKEGDKESLKTLESEVTDLFETLVMHRRHAIEIADQLALRFP